MVVVLESAVLCAPPPEATRLKGDATGPVRDPCSGKSRGSGGSVSIPPSGGCAARRWAGVRRSPHLMVDIFESFPLANGRGGIEWLRRRMRARLAERVHMLRAPFR